MSSTQSIGFLEKIIEIGIAIEIEISCNANQFNPDLDSDFDFDPEKNSLEAFTVEFMTMT